MEKFKISIIDFMPHFKKIEVGKYEDGSPAFLGDLVEYDKGKRWFISYRYGKIMLKQVGMMAMIAMKGFEEGDFSKVKKTNIIGAGDDWLIIGFVDEKLFEDLKPLFEVVSIH